MSIPIAQPSGPRRRDAETSRRAILDAAEELFGEHGLDGASLAAVGRRAGVSSGLPSYFFGDKEGVYRAVMARLLADREALLGPVAERAVGIFEGADDLRAALDVLIGAYVDFLRSRPALVRLMGREALDGGRRLGPEPRHSVAVEDGLTRLLGRLRPGVDPQQLVITTVALCFFPLEHNATMLAAMGLDARSESFAAERKQHVVDVLLQVLSSA